MTAHNVIQSNAFNSASFVSGGVDARTGQYTVSISLPEVIGNALCGPRLPMTLSFSPVNHSDSGFGRGWSLALSQYSPISATAGVLSLLSGETFKVEGTNTTPRIPEQKLETFKFFTENPSRYRVVNKNGMIEVLEMHGSQGAQVALPVQIHSALGHHINLSYRSAGGFHVLHEIRQADGQLLLRLHPGNGSLDIRYLAGTESSELCNFLLQMDGDQLRELVLPTDNAARWRFEYETVNGLLCMKAVDSPHGAQQIIEHNDLGHAFPGVSRPALPRVTRHVLRPGREQPAVESRYEYSDENFLGFGAPGLQFPDDGLDALYQVNGPYEYSSVQTQWHDGVPGRSVECRYNRYHLLTERTTRNGNALLIQTTEYGIDDNLAFDLQLPQCQLPRRTTTRWALANDATQVHEQVETTLFDMYGNPVERVAPNGGRETWSYYSPLGEPGCPADPYGFTRQVKEHRRLPAPALPAATAALHPHGNFGPRPSRRPAPFYHDEPTLVSRYTYTTHAPLENGLEPMLVLDEQIDSECLGDAEQVLLRTRHRYVDDPQDSLRHGLPDSIIEERLGHQRTTRYSYVASHQPAAVTYTQSVTHSLDGSQTQASQLIALYSGLLLEMRSDDGQVIAYEHDALRRVVSETVMPDDPQYRASRHYRYRLGNVAGQCGERWEVDAKGVETHTETDGLGRIIRTSRQKADGSSGAQSFRLLYSARYGDEHELLESTHHDWLGDTPLALTVAYEYDHWDQCCRTVDSTGIASHSVGDPFTRTLTEWQDGMAKTVTHLDRFDQPERVAVYALDGQRIALQHAVHDGLGRLRLSIGSGGERTEHRYDGFGRTTHTLLADGTLLRQHYAQHSTAALVTQLQVTPGNRLLPATVAGTQVFDGLERLTATSSGTRTQQFRYEGGRNVPSERLTASQQSIHYDYNLVLSDEPTAIRAEQASSFEFDPITAQLNRAVSTEGRLEYQYDNLGQLTLERSVVTGQVRETHFASSTAGRPLQRLDFGGVRSEYQYDAHGRPQQLQEGQLQVTFEYNAQGLRARTTTHDIATGNNLVTEVEYDEQGRETLRVQRMSRAQEHRTRLLWAPDGQLRQRELRIGEQLSLRETFNYDLRGRLVQHTCSGADLPTDRYGNAIVEQLFYFDGLDNLLYCESCFADGSRDFAEHFYADDDRCQLRSVQHSHPDYPAQILLTYDADGNLQSDSDGRVLEYDRQGRLLRVEWPRGTALTQYRYNAHNQLQGVIQGSGVETLRFYQDHQLRTTLQGARHSSLLYDGATPLGQQTLNDIDSTLLTLCGDNQSVLAEVQGNSAARHTQYTSHGEASEPLESVLGYNGEVREASTGWYLLGSGYRAYNPQLRIFHSPDSASPFGVGGINPYAYCLGNPIRYRDPSGHAAQPGKAARERRKALKGASWQAFAGYMAFGTVAAGLFSMVFPGAGIGFLALNMVEETGRNLFQQYLDENEEESVIPELMFVIDMLEVVGQLPQTIEMIGELLPKLSKDAISKAASEVTASLAKRRHSAPAALGDTSPAAPQSVAAQPALELKLSTTVIDRPTRTVTESISFSRPSRVPDAAPPAPPVSPPAPQASTTLEPQPVTVIRKRARPQNLTPEEELRWAFGGTLQNKGVSNIDAKKAKAGIEDYAKHIRTS